VDAPDLVGPSEVRDGPCDTKHAMKSARGQAHRRRGIRQQLAAWIVGRRDLVEQFASASALVRGPCPL